MRAASRATASFWAVCMCSRSSNDPSSGEGAGKAPRFRSGISGKLVLEMEDLLEQDQALVRAAALQADEERGHLGLPAGVDVGPGHGVERSLQVIGLDVADQEAVAAQEQAVVPPARRGQGPQHLRPDLLVAPPVLVQAVGADAQQETVPSAHGSAPPGVGGRRNCGSPIYAGRRTAAQDDGRATGPPIARAEPARVPEVVRVTSGEQVLVPWPAAPLTSREPARVRVSGAGMRSAWSDPATVEAGLLGTEDWTARFISPCDLGGLGAPAPCGWTATTWRRSTRPPAPGSSTREPTRSWSAGRPATSGEPPGSRWARAARPDPWVA